MPLLVWLFCLMLARVGTFVALLPFLGGRALPRLTKVGLALALTVVWFVPVAEAVSPTALLHSAAFAPTWTDFMAIGREVFLGAVLGYGLGLCLVPAQVAGEFVTQEMGLSFGSQVNPTGEGSSSPITQILEFFALVLFFGADGHHVLLGVLHGTFALYPVTGSSPDLPMARLIEGASAAEEYGVMLAAPVALVLFLTTVLLAVLTRVAPQLHLYSVGFPLRIGVGMATMLLLLPTWVAAVGAGFNHFGQLVSQLL